MKKLLLIFCLAAAPAVFGFENYIITSDKTITTIENKTPDIINIREITTIMNEKNTVIVECQKEGKGKFVLTSGGEKSEFSMNITKNKTELKTSGDYSCYILDTAPGVFEIDPPPAAVHKKRISPKGLTSIEIKIGDEDY